MLWRLSDKVLLIFTFYLIIAYFTQFYPFSSSHSTTISRTYSSSSADISSVKFSPSIISHQKIRSNFVIRIYIYLLFHHPPIRIPNIISIFFNSPSSLFEFIMHPPNIRSYSSLLYIPLSAYHIRLYIVKRRTDSCQLDRHPPSYDRLSVQLLLPPIIRHYSSSSAAIYDLLSCHWLSSVHIPFHFTFPNQHTLFQFIIHYLISRSDYITDELKEDPIITNYTITLHHQTLYQFNYHQPSSSHTIPVYQQTYIIYYPFTNIHQSLFQLIIHYPNTRSYSSSLYIPPSAYHIRLYIVKRRTDYYQIYCHPPSEDPLSVQILSPPISRHSSSSSADLYNLLSCHRFSSGYIPVH